MRRPTGLGVARGLAQTRQQLTTTLGAELEHVREAQASGGRAGSRICWMRTLALRRSFAR